jgi:hypothetical protein
MLPRASNHDVIRLSVDVRRPGLIENQRRPIFAIYFDRAEVVFTVLVVPTENSVCPSTIRQSPCSIVTFGVVTEGRNVGASIWMLLILTLFACDIILANHRLAPRARYSGVLRCSKDAGAWLL